jgi:hypothetical protein
VTRDWELLDNLAEIAADCINYDVDPRPTMRDIAKRLLTIQKKYRDLTTSSSTS